MYEYREPDLGSTQPWLSHEVVPLTEAQVVHVINVLGLPPRLPGELWHQFTGRLRAGQDARGLEVDIISGATPQDMP